MSSGARTKSRSHTELDKSLARKGEAQRIGKTLIDKPSSEPSKLLINEKKKHIGAMTIR
jgi:hypothetical protein